MIHIVIPVFNRKKFTRDCLASLRNQTYREFHTIVVDDGSTDGTGEMLRNEFPEATVLRGDGNLFWTAATNMGIRHALKEGTDFVMTLNNDTIAYEDFLEKMMFWAEKERDSLLGALGVDATTRQPAYGGEIIDWKWSSGTYLLDVLKEDERTGLHEVSFFPGRGLLIPRAVFEKVGLFDEKTFPHYAADNDFTLSAKQHGFKVYCNYDARIYIYPNASDARMNKISRSMRRYFDHLFSRKGGGNLKVYTQFVIRHCPKAEIPLALLVGYARRIGGYWMK